MAVDLIDRRASVKTITDMLRVDHLIDSRHKFVAAAPHVVTVEHDGEDLRLALPSQCPPCDFRVTSAVDDFLFLIGSQRPGREGENCQGAVVIARKGQDGIYATELWHETHVSFVKRVRVGTTC